MNAGVFALGLVVLAGMALAAPVNVSGNVTLEINDTAGALSYPGGIAGFNASGNVSLTREFNLTMDVPERVNASINLSRGELRTLSGSYDVLSLACTNETSTVVVNATAVCNASRSLSRGERYRVNEGACNLDVSCSSDGRAGNESFEYTQAVGVRKEGGVLTLTVANTSRAFSIDLLNASDEIPFKILCPRDFREFSGDDDAKLAYDYCTDQFPRMNEWLNLTLNRCFDNFDAYRDFVNAHNSQVIAANQELSDVKARSSAQESAISLKNEQILQLEEALAQRDGRLDTLLYVTGFLVVAVIVLVAAVALLWGKADASDVSP